jgi:hypothetical protein
VRECGEWDARAVDGVVECEADVVETQDVVWARREVRVEICAVAFLARGLGVVG